MKETASARKPVGGLLVPLEFSSGEERYVREPAHNAGADIRAALGAFGDRSSLSNFFRHEIADTVADPGEVESERRYLAAVIMRK